MGLLRNLLEEMREQQKERDEIDDDKTQDRFLRSLRRQRRTQREFVEKLRLKKEIHDFDIVPNFLYCLLVDSSIIV